MENFALHNVRFYDFQPEAIHCLAYNDKDNLLALSRTYGSIELWNCYAKPFKTYTLIGQKDDSVEALIWCQSRLFSSSLHGKLFEYDIHSFHIKYQEFVTGGATWCLALSPDKKILAAGTEGGIVSLYDVIEDGLMLNRMLQRQKGRILSMGWHADSTHLATGSTLYVHLINIETEKVLQFPVGKVTPSSDVIVWCVGILNDMTIVTADTRGKTCFWDGTFGTQISEMQTHLAGCLTMQISKDSQTVYVSGQDPLIAEMRFVDSKAKQGKRHMWVRGVPRKIHSHDVRALQLTKQGKLYSGGVDTCLQLSYYPPKTVIKYPATPPRGYISIATKSHSVLLGYKDRVELWKLGKGANKESENRFLSVTEDRIKLAEIELRKDERLEFCAVSPKSNWIALCVKKKIRIYSIIAPEGHEEGSLEKVRYDNEDVLPCSQMLWLDEERLLSATYSNVLQVIAVDSNKVSVQRTIPVLFGGMVRIMTSSENGLHIAVLDSMNQVTLLDIRGDDHRSILMPKTKVPVTALAIDKNERIFITYSDMTMTEYSIINAFCTPFGRALVNCNSTDLSKQQNVIQNISFHAPYVFLHTINSIIRVTNAQNEATEIVSEPTNKSRRSESRKIIERNCVSGKEGNKGMFSIVARSNLVYLFSHLSDGNMISVEKNQIALFDSLPPALKVKKFGAS